MRTLRGTRCVYTWECLGLPIKTKDQDNRWNRIFRLRTIPWELLYFYCIVWKIVLLIVSDCIQTYMHANFYWIYYKLYWYIYTHTFYFIHIILFKVSRINESISEEKKDTKFSIRKNLNVILLAKIMRGNQLDDRCIKIKTER